MKFVVIRKTSFKLKLNARTHTHLRFECRTAPWDRFVSLWLVMNETWHSISYPSPPTKVVVVLIKKNVDLFLGWGASKTDYGTIRITVFLKLVVIDRQPDNKSDHLVLVIRAASPSVLPLGATVTYVGHCVSAWLLSLSNARMHRRVKGRDGNELQAGMYLKEDFLNLLAFMWIDVPVITEVPPFYPISKPLKSLMFLIFLFHLGCVIEYRRCFVSRR
jgi:hypothetical protein